MEVSEKDSTLPSSFTAIAEYTKVVVPVCTALLGATVAFADKLISPHPSRFQKILLICSWGTLLIAVFFGVLAIAYSINIVTKGRKGNAAIFSANAALFALLAAACCLVLLGLSQILLADSWGQVDAVKHAVSLMRSVDAEEGKWVVNDIDWSATDQTALMIVQGKKSGQRYTISIDMKGRKASKVKREN